jgi:hypothetical protein
LRLGYDAHLVADCSATFTKSIQQKTEQKLADRVTNAAQLIKSYQR